MARRFDVMKTKIDSPFEGALQRLLGLHRDRLGIKVIPALLKTHSPEGKHRHGKLGASKTARGKTSHTSVRLRAAR